MQEHPHSIALRWVHQAQDDLRIAGALADERSYNNACFLCQQAAEKALKGLLIWRCGDYPRLHVIEKLLDELGAVDPALANELRETQALDPYYVSTRYPDALDGALPATAFFAKEAALAIERATMAVRRIAQILDDAGRP